MQYINHWPDMAEPTLPESISRDVYKQLLEPFDSETAAKEFWNETSSTLIILDSTDTVESLHRDPLWTQIDFALTYPEYTVPLSMDYTLLVAIVNDSGNAIYLVVPPELSHIIPGGDTHE